MADVPPPSGPAASTSTPTPRPAPAAAASAAGSLPKAPLGSVPKPPENVWFYAFGIPDWVFKWRPKVPSRNTMIFVGVPTALLATYAYDRYETSRILKMYEDKVRWMSQERIESGDNVRLVRVLGSRVPEDYELERSTKWFKKFMKPILVASGTDFHLLTGTNVGALGRTLAHEIRARRLAQAAKDKQSAGFALENSAYDNVTAVLEEREAKVEANELEGGVILLGRGALKEYLWGLKEGWTTPIDLREEAKMEGLGLGARDRRKGKRWEREEELMVRELDEEDTKKGGGPFDATEEVAPEADQEAAGQQQQQAFLPSYSNLGKASPPAQQQLPDGAPAVLPPPTHPPEQPPLLLVRWNHPFGMIYWPTKIAHFFNHRSDATLAGESVLKILAAQTRTFAPPSIRQADGSSAGLLNAEEVKEFRKGEHFETVMADGVPTGSQDLDFCFEEEETPAPFARAYRKFPKATEFKRREFLEGMAPQLKAAREIAAGREPTKKEVKSPPKLEADWRRERLDYELKWRREMEGWAIRRSGSGVTWDDSWSDTGVLKVFGELTESDRARLEDGKRSLEERQARAERGEE